MRSMLSDRLVSEAYRDPRYRGKQVIIIGGKIFAARTEQGAVRLFKRLTKRHPRETPLITVIPKADSLILWVL